MYYDLMIESPPIYIYSVNHEYKFYITVYHGSTKRMESYFFVKPFSALFHIM